MNEEKVSQATRNAQYVDQPIERLRPSRDLVVYLRRYARERPAVVALCCIGVGFVLGWKLKPW